MSEPRHAEIAITWESIEITRDIAPYLLGVTYTDNLTGAADDFSITLEDRDGNWSGGWKPTFGDVAEATITAKPWLTDVEKLRVGRFAHDKITLSGPPSIAEIKCISAPLATGLRRRKRTRTWRNRTLVEIAEDIAERAGVDSDWLGAEGLRYKQRIQRDKSDLEFLEELCTEVGRCIKICESEWTLGKSAIVIFPEDEQDQSHSVGELDLKGGYVKAWSFDADDSARYGSCHITFFDPRTGKTVSGEVKDPANPDGQTLEVRLPVNLAADAVTICKGKLRQANRFANAGHLEVMGDPGLVAGVVFELVNARGFNGRYIITKATHRPVGGYTCGLDVRRCIEGY